MDQPVSAATEIAQGNLQGVARDGVLKFSGIPYARPPVGALRWRPPQPARAWSSPRNAQAFGPRCTQEERPADSLGNFGREPQSEDCLTLNVWSAAPASERRPVFVWFHGGR